MATGGLLVGLYAVGDFGAVSLLRFESLSEKCESIGKLVDGFPGFAEADGERHGC